MTNNRSKLAVVTSLELMADDGVRLVSLTLGMTLYTKAKLTQNAGAVLRLQEKFLALCPKDVLAFYATESMRRHKPITKSTFTMLSTWLKAGAPSREYVCLQLKDGDQYQDAPRYKFDVYGFEPKGSAEDGNANLLSLGFPPSAFKDDPDSLRGLFIDLCTIFPFQSGCCGWVLECSKYEQETSQTHAWSLSTRYKGIDIYRMVEDSIAVGHDAVKGVGWLTALDSNFVAALGGMSKIRKCLGSDVEIIELPRGLLLQAGAAPILGDVNRNDDLRPYRKVFELLAPLIEIAKRRSPALNLATDYVERTESWFARLSDG